jgi:hypothetical protein
MGYDALSSVWITSEKKCRFSAIARALLFLILLCLEVIWLISCASVALLFTLENHQTLAWLSDGF